MTSVIRRTAVLGISSAIASVGLLGAATASPSHLRTTTLTIHAPATVSGATHFKATVTGKLRARRGPLAGETVSLQQRSGTGKAWTDTGQSQTTDSNGKVSFTFTQQARHEQYRLSFAGDSTYRKTHSGTVTITRVRTHPTPTPSPTA